MKPGDIVQFPSDKDGYTLQQGLLIGFHDNPSDVKLIKRDGKPPGYCQDGPRQVARVLYRGKIMTCWGHSLRFAKSGATQ